VDREDDYRKRRLNRVISPARNDALTMVRPPRRGCGGNAHAPARAVRAPRRRPPPRGRNTLTRLARRRRPPRAPPQGDQTPDASVRTYADVMREQQLAREREAVVRALADKQKENAEAGEAARRAAALDAMQPTKSSGVEAPAPSSSSAGSQAGAGDKRRNRWDSAPKCVDAAARAALLRAEQRG
jgi:hypothetical protein